MKQRTYLIIFVKQTTYLITLPDRSPRQRNSKKTKRDLSCATPLRSRDLIRLVRLLRTFLHAAQSARRMSCLSILILRSSTKTALNSQPDDQAATNKALKAVSLSLTGSARVLLFWSTIVIA